MLLVDFWLKNMVLMDFYRHFMCHALSILSGWEYFCFRLGLIYDFGMDKAFYHLYIAYAA